jgi:hypothetical protein
MDPYLEAPALWPDVHQRLITYVADSLQLAVRPHYHARIGERLYVVDTLHTLYPDVTLVSRPMREAAIVDVATPPKVAAPADVDTPVRIVIPPTEYREPFVEIVHTAGGEVVTVIEVLSPANKAHGEGHRLYRRKQREVLSSEAHLIEIDLLSEGLPTVALPEAARARLEPHRYLVSAVRKPDRYAFELYPVPLQRRLPRIGVPLRETHPDVALDLQAIFSQCYDNGGYADFLDYRQPPPVSLSAGESAWTEKLLRGTQPSNEDTGP